jgi:Tfp pilus assembly protein PilV
MSDQQTEVNYDQQYEQQHGNGEFHHEPIHAEPAATYGITPSSSPPKREPKRAWPLTARLAVTVLIIGLATLTAMSLISLQAVSKRDTQANQLVNSEQASLNAMRGQLAAVQAKVATPLQLPKPYKPPAVLQHYGVCVALGRDTSSGALTTVSLTAPTMTGGQVSCGTGTFVSVVP